MASTKAQNRLIRAIPASYRKAFVADLTPTEIAAHSVLAAAGRPMPEVHFPVGAVISALYQSGGMAIEIHGVGREGMLGSDVLFAPEHIRFDLVCQIPGSLLSMPYTTFKAHIQQSDALARTLSLYSLSVLAFLTQSAACNGLHTIAQRCARWLLTTCDRVGALEFPLTHDLLARLLGVRRPGVSIAVSRLQHLALIQYHFGRIRILDKENLEAESCECYGIVVRETARIFRRATTAGASPRGEFVG